MPRGDNTGPMGMGSMSGRGAGYCAGFGMPGYANPVSGRGLGGGFGRGRGRVRRNMFQATGQPGRMRFGGYGEPYGYAKPFRKPDLEMEMAELRNQAQVLQSELDLIKNRLGDIEAGTAAE